MLVIFCASISSPTASLRLFAPADLRSFAHGAGGDRFSRLTTIPVGEGALLLRQLPRVAKERVREMDLSGQKAGRRSWSTTRAAEGRGLVRRFAYPDLHRTALLKAPKIKYPP